MLILEQLREWLESDLKLEGLDQTKILDSKWELFINNLLNSYIEENYEHIMLQYCDILSPEVYSKQ